MRVLNFWAEGEQLKYVTKTQGYWVHYQHKDKPCLDITTGYGAFVLGYNHPDILSALQSDYAVNFLRGNSGETTQNVDALAEKICSLGDWDSVAWSVSGSDAVETAIAMNDRYWEMTSGYRHKIISFYPGYNGTTMLGKHLRGEYRELGRATVLKSPQWIFQEDQEEQEQITLNQIRSILENDTKKEYGCLIFESSPWIDDMLPWSPNWWKQIRSICDEFGILMVLDDVAICWGKHGAWFGNQPFGVQPDISAIGKALTGGYSPLGAAVVNKKAGQVLRSESWDHGHTWQPNMAGVAASLAVTQFITDNNLLSRARSINQELRKITDAFGFNARGNYTFVIMDTPKPVTLQDLHVAGLCSGLPVRGSTTGQIKIAAPLIADEEYFIELKNRLKLVI